MQLPTKTKKSLLDTSKQSIHHIVLYGFDKISQREKEISAFPVFKSSKKAETIILFIFFQDWRTSCFQMEAYSLR